MTREEMIAKLRRDDMIQKLKADDMAKASSPATEIAPTKIPSDPQLYAEAGRDLVRPVEAFNEAFTGMIPGTDTLKAAGTYIGNKLVGNDQGWMEGARQNEANQAQLAQDYPNITTAGQGAGIIPSMGLPTAATVGGRFALNNALGFGEKALTGQDMFNTESAVQFGASLVEPVMKGFSAPSFQSAKRTSAIQTLDPQAREAFVMNNKGSTDAVADAIAEEASFGQSRASLANRLEQRVQDAGQNIGELRAKADAAGAEVDLRPAARKSGTMAAFSEGGDKADASLQADWAADYAKNEPIRSVQQVADINTKLGEKGAYDKILPSQEARAARGLRSEYVGATEGAMSKVLPPEDMAQYAKSRQEFGLYKTGDEILDKTVARNSKQGVAGIKDLLAVGRNPDSLEGTAKNMLVAATIKQVRQRAGSSATAMFKGLENLARKFPNETPAVKNWMSQLSNAAARSPEAIGATYYVLQKQDPEFRQAIQDEDSQLP